MDIKIIVAYSKNNAIGKDNKLLWHLADDMAFFKEMTSGKTVLMGRKTYESLPPRFRPLPHRLNLVISSQKLNEKIENLEWFESIKDAISYCKSKNIEEIFVIGGGQIYAEWLEKADTIYATEVDVEIEGDTFFPKIDFRLYSRELLHTYPKSEKNEYSFEIAKYSLKK